MPDAVLDVFGIHSLRPGEDAWKSWEGGMLPQDIPQHVKNSVRVHPTIGRRELIDAMRAARMISTLVTNVKRFACRLLRRRPWECRQ